MLDIRYDVQEPIDDLVFMSIRRNVSGMLQGRVEGILLSRTHKHECWNHGKVPHKAVIHIGPRDVLPRFISKQRTGPGIKGR